MNAKQKKFIQKTLIPFILRAGGNGFAMDHWKADYSNSIKESVDNGDPFYFDNVNHKFPVCGTVACIGGSIQCLTNLRSLTGASKVLGLTTGQVSGLFYHWEQGDGYEDTGWPAKFRRLFKVRKTPLGKAKVAVALLQEVVKTNGQCLEPSGVA